MGSEANNKFELRNHFGVVVKDLDIATKMWSKMLAPLGIGPWQITEVAPKKEDIIVGKPFRIKAAIAVLEALGSDFQLELIEELEGDMIWSQFSKKHGEIWHHLEMYVPDYDEALSNFQKHGAKMIFSMHSPLGKRVCYLEMQPGGCIWALLER